MLGRSSALLTESCLNPAGGAATSSDRHRHQARVEEGARAGAPPLLRPVYCVGGGPGGGGGGGAPVPPSMISVRRFCGSRTPSGVGTLRSV